MKKVLLHFVLGLAGVAALVYGVDYLSVVTDIPQREMYSTIRVEQLYAIPNKWNEVDWSRGEAQMVQCVNSLLPHFGVQPCWYIRRDTMHVNKL